MERLVARDSGTLKHWKRGRERGDDEEWSYGGGLGEGGSAICEVTHIW